MKNPWLLFALVCGAAISAGLAYVTIYAGGLALDFGVFWKAARTPIGMVYRPDDFAPFVYPPSAVPWFRPLALLPMWSAFAMWSALSVGAFMALADTPKRWLLLASPALVQCVVFGQTSLLVAAVVLACSEGWVMGALIGVAFTIKPQLVFLAPIVLAVRGDCRALGGFVLASIACVGATAALYGIEPWRDWISALQAFNDVLARRDLYWVTITPAGTAQRFGIDPTLPFIIGAGLALLAAIRSDADDPRPVIVYTSLLATPYAVMNDLAALLPFCLAALVSKSDRKLVATLVFSGVLAPLALAIWAVQDVADA